MSGGPEIAGTYRVVNHDALAKPVSV